MVGKIFRLDFEFTITAAYLEDEEAELQAEIKYILLIIYHFDQIELWDMYICD